MDILTKKRGVPLQDREETVTVMKALMGVTTATDTASSLSLDRPALSNVHGIGPLLLSDIPASCSKEGGVVLGIDEAGRGSVLGPMIYGAAFWSTADEELIPKDFNDSKQLTEEKRAQLLKKILDKTPEIGFCVRVLDASEISRNMLRREPYNLNQMSHDSAAEMITHVLKAGVQVTEAFIDTVGNADHYKRRLEREFPSITFTVESKADAKYAPCSAASVVAKNVRDKMMLNFRFSESGLDSDRKFGSGYPSDPVCKAWMTNNQKCKTYGFPDVVRFSWNPVKKMLEDQAIAVTFEADEDDDEGGFGVKKKRSQPQLSAFLPPSTTVKRKRYPLFKRKRLEVVDKLF